MVHTDGGSARSRGRPPAARPGQRRPIRCGRRTWQWAAMAVVGLAMASGGCGGCGGCGCVGSKYSRASPEEIAEVKENLRKKAARATAKSAAAKPQVPQRPQEVSAWKKQDYFSARAEGDPRLLDAVERLGRQHPGQESAARLLRGLLEPETPPGASPATRSARAHRLGPEQAQAILAALAANGTAPALEQILSGELAIDGKTCAQAAAAALAHHPAPENEAILYRALTQARDTQSPESKKKAVSGFDSMVLAAVRPEAAEQFRARLAQHVVDPATSDSLRERLAVLLQEPRVENLGAQTLLYRQFQTPAETTRLEAYFTAYSSAMLRRLLGIPEQAPGGSWSASSRDARVSDKAASARAHKAAAGDPSLAPHAAAHLWKSGFADLLADRLYHVDSLERQAPLVVLAGTIPLDSVRSRVYATLARNWQDGPAAIESAGLPAQVVSDPGLIVAIKMLPHGAFDAAARRPSTSKAAGRTDVHQARMQREKVKGAWARFCGELVLATCRRLETASRARAAAVGSGEPPAPRLPLAMHDSARVVARYRAAWPDDVRSQASGTSVDPMEINYVRVEETNRYQKLLGYYRRQVGARQESTDRQGAWLEAVRDVPGTGRKLSLDVVIRKAAKDDTYEKLDKDEKLTVEILAVEIKDPAREDGDRRAAR